jgi:oxalate decarboxylase/phosphoglucose isomerase-like protein (cupin superfamily)
MQGVEFVREGDKLYAIVVRARAASADKYNFLTDNAQPLQLGMSFYKAGEIIKNHAHLPRDIRVDKVQEVLVIGEGSARLTLFDDDRRKLTDMVLSRGDICLLAAGGHGLEVIEDMKLVEVKQGPYDGQVKDKVQF